LTLWDFFVCLHINMIDLHLHLDGAISLRSARQLAALQGIAVPADDSELLEIMRVNPDCRSLNDFLKKFAFPNSLLQSTLGLSTAVYNLCEELRASGLIYAEIRFAPQLACRDGFSQEDAVLAAIDGLKKSALPANLIISCLRGHLGSPDGNRETVRLAAKYLGKGVCATDLAGPEKGYPMELYRELFAYARSIGVPFEIHAGEDAGPENVRTAVEFGASRIGHGISSVEDPELMAMLAEKKVAMMLCPTSNLQTCVIKRLSELPVRTFMNAGIPIAICTDDPSVEGTDLKSEWRKTIETFHLSEDEIRRLMLNAVDAAFCDESLRTRLRTQVGAHSSA